MRIRGNRKSKFASPITDNISWDIKTGTVSVSGVDTDGYKGLLRNDSNDLLNIVSKWYNPITNEQFIGVVDQMKDLTGFSLHGYTEYDNGRKVLAYLQNLSDTDVAGFKTNEFMVMGNSFDSSTAFFTGSSNTILRCTNQFGRIHDRHSIRHNGQADVKIQELIRLYEGFMHEERTQKEKFESWHGIRIPIELKELFVDEVLEIEPLKKVSSFKLIEKEKLFHSINVEMNAMGENAFGLFNGLTHYTTHVKESKSKVLGNLFGITNTLNKRGYNFIDQYLNELV